MPGEPFDSLLECDTIKCNTIYCRVSEQPYYILCLYLKEVLYAEK